MGGGPQDAEAGPDSQGDGWQLAKVADSNPTGTAAEANRDDIRQSIMPCLRVGDGRGAQTE